MPINLAQPSIGSTNWGAAVNANWQTIQSALNGLSGRNRIINGAMEIWQRGTAQSVTASAKYLADRWNVICSAGSGLACTNSRDADVPSLAQAGVIFPWSNKILITTPEASITGTELCCWKYNVEGYDFRELWQRETTLSFWMKTNKQGTYGIGLNNIGPSAPDRAYVKEFYHSGSDWQKFTFTIPASSSGGTWNLANDVGLRIYITIACGSTYQQATQDTWNTVSQYNCTPNTISTDNVSSTYSFYLTGVQFEVGNVATQFEWRPFQQELALCQRYTYVVSGASGYYTPGSGYRYGTSAFEYWFRSPVPMRTTPSSVSDNVTGLATAAPAGTNVAIVLGTSGGYMTGSFSDFAIAGYSTEAMYMYLSGTSFTGSGGDACYILLGPDVRLIYSADWP